jgi:hypothetical protein
MHPAFSCVEDCSNPGQSLLSKLCSAAASTLPVVCRLNRRTPREFLERVDPAVPLLIRKCDEFDIPNDQAIREGVRS